MSPHRKGQHQRLWGECSPCTSRESPRCDLCRERLVGARRHHEAEAAQHQCWAAPGQAAGAPHQTSLSLSPHCGCDREGCCVPGHRRDAGQGTLVLQQPWAERGQSRLPFAPHPGLAPPPKPLPARCLSLYAGTGQAALSQNLALFCTFCAAPFPVLPFAKLGVTSGAVRSHSTGKVQQKTGLHHTPWCFYGSGTSQRCIQNQSFKKKYPFAKI